MFLELGIAEEPGGCFISAFREAVVIPHVFEVDLNARCIVRWGKVL